MNSHAWVSAPVLARFFTTIVLSPVAGVFADRYERRTVLVVSDLTQLN
jgi:hypothetical protein